MPQHSSHCLTQARVLPCGVSVQRNMKEAEEFDSPETVNDTFPRTLPFFHIFFVQVALCDVKSVHFTTPMDSCRKKWQCRSVNKPLARVGATNVNKSVLMDRRGITQIPITLNPQHVYKVLVTRGVVEIKRSAEIQWVEIGISKHAPASGSSRRNRIRKPTKRNKPPASQDQQIETQDSGLGSRSYLLLAYLIALNLPPSMGTFKESRRSIVSRI